MPIYMKYEGIEGAVTGKYKGWIELQSCQLGVIRNVTSVTGNTANRNMANSDIGLTKFQDNVSMQLFKESLSGTGKKVTIDFVKEGESAPYLSIELENVLISSYSISGHGGSSQEKPMESLSLSYTKITYSAKPTAASKDPKSAPDKVTWDLVIK